MHTVGNAMKKTFSAIHGDCIEVMDSLPEHFVDVVITSPPYNIGTKYNEYDDSKSTKDYIDWIRSVFVSIERVLGNEGHFFLNIGGTCVDQWTPIDILCVASDYFVLQNTIIWVKSITIEGNTIGHSKPINSERFLNNNWEYVFHFTKTGEVPINRLSIGVPYKDKSNLTRGNRGKNGDTRCGGNVWMIPYETISSKSEKGNHPAVFPKELVRRCLLLSGASPNHLVLDPFIGSGTTLNVCRELDTNCIGIDIDREYIDYCSRKIDAEVLY